MHSKRLLYKPTTREKAVSKEKRKPLVQGRLASEPLAGALDPAPVPQGASIREPRSLFEKPTCDGQVRKALTSSPVPSCNDPVPTHNRRTVYGKVECITPDPTASSCSSCHSDLRHKKATRSGSPTNLQSINGSVVGKGTQRHQLQVTTQSKDLSRKTNPDNIMGNLRPKRRQTRTLHDTGSRSQHRLSVPAPDSVKGRPCLREGCSRKGTSRRKLEENARTSSWHSKDAHNSQQQKCPGDVPSTQSEVDLMYARYLQAVYLESRALRAYKQQEQHVMTELSQMAGLVTEKQKQKEELEELVTRLHYDNHRDDALHTQEAGLVPVVLGLERLRKQYGTLSAALDKTRHQLPMRGVHTPHNMDQFIAQLNTTLTESEQLLGELTIICRDKQRNVKTFSDRLHALAQTTDQQTQELSGCQQALDAVSVLTVQESSLRIQDLQLGSS